MAELIVIPSDTFASNTTCRKRPMGSVAIVLFVVATFGVFATSDGKSVHQNHEAGHEYLRIKRSKADDHHYNKPYDNIAIKEDSDLQECTESVMKRTFPDVDYALLGYNLIKGYPLAFGHDPGFTFPIFKADYKSRKQTADCRYSIPDGMVIIPEVSCVTSFSSKVLQTSYEFSKSLSTSAHVGGGGWGFSFQASAGYKEASSAISSGEYVTIISSAHCNYYFSKLMLYNPPEFSAEFIAWIDKLDKSNGKTDEKNAYFEFFDYFGTHYSLEITFGATYNFEHKMKSSSYKTQIEKGVNVEASASYSGAFSVSGGFSMDSSEKQAASEFRKEVSTRTITAGAPPPANGDAMTWASSVKDSPVPVKYKLAPIHNLFSDQYMSSLKKIDYRRISSNIEKYFKEEYCFHLQEQGLIDSCEKKSVGLSLMSTKLSKHVRSTKSALITDCIDQCLQQIDCVALSFCTKCESGTSEFETCYMFSEKQTEARGTENEDWETIFTRTKIDDKLVITDTAINGDSRGSTITRAETKDECIKRCTDDAHCIAVSYCECEGKTENCQLYADDRINHLYEEQGTTVYFLKTQPKLTETATDPPASTGNTTPKA